MQDERREQDVRRSAAVSDDTPPAGQPPRTREGKTAEDDAVSGPQERGRQGQEKARPLRHDDAGTRPVPGVKHEPEPDAGNIMPAEDEPGTL